MTKSFTVEQLRCLELARIIREGLEGVRFDMTLVHGDCGTAGCIAGYAIAKYRPDICAGTFPHSGHAREILGLTIEQAERLFFPGLSSGEIYCSDITSAMAAATLENYALTGKVEWPQP